MSMRSGPPARPFPFGSITAVFVALALGAAGLSYFSWHAGNEVARLTDNHVLVQRRASELQQQGRMLELSARLVAATGDLRYAALYDSASRRVRHALADLSRRIGERDGSAELHHIGRADSDLARLERRAIGLAREGRLQEAQALLASPFYKALLPAYYNGAGRLQERSRRYMIEQEMQLSAYQDADLAASILVLFVILLIWAFVVRPVRSWGRIADAAYVAETSRLNEELRELNSTLERRVEESTEARLRAEANLRQSQKMDALGRLTGGIAHDFNNMLAVVVSGIELAQRRLRGPVREVELCLREALHGAHSARSLTQRLLAFSRSSQLVPQRIAPKLILEGMLGLLDRALGPAAVIRTSFDEEIAYVHADANQLESAILNLCLNARDAILESAAGTGDVLVEVASEEIVEGSIGSLSGGTFVRISVQDNGIGIAPGVLDHVFDPFFTTKPLGQGTGLGLSSVLGFVRQSGGDLRISSEQGAGTIVSIYLPQVGVEPAAPAAFPREQPATQPEYGPRAEILLVEDDPRVRRSLVSLLHELRHDVSECSDAQEAIELLAGPKRFDLLVADVMLPGMDGIELTRHAQTLRPGLAALLVTGYGGSAAAERRLEDFDHLRKPFTLAELATAIESARKKAFAAEVAPPAAE